MGNAFMLAKHTQHAVAAHMRVDSVAALCGWKSFAGNICIAKEQTAWLKHVISTNFT